MTDTRQLSPVRLPEEATIVGSKPNTSRQPHTNDRNTTADNTTYPWNHRTIHNRRGAAPTESHHRRRMESTNSRLSNGSLQNQSLESSVHTSSTAADGGLFSSNTANEPWWQHAEMTAPIIV